MQEAIGKELRFQRIRNNLELEDVANFFNCSKETLRRYEKNSSGLSVERLEEILDYYNVDKSIFFRNVCENMHKNE